MAVELRRRRNFEGKLGLRAPRRQQGRVSASIAAEAEVRTFDHSLRLEAVNDDAIEKLAHGHIEQPMSGLEDDDVGCSRLFEQFDFPFGPNQRRRHSFRAEQHQRMRVERQGQGRRVRVIGEGAQSSDQARMAAMHSIEVADREKSPLGLRGSPRSYPA